MTFHIVCRQLNGRSTKVGPHTCGFQHKTVTQEHVLFRRLIREKYSVIRYRDIDFQGKSSPMHTTREMPQSGSSIVEETKRTSKWSALRRGEQKGIQLTSYWKPPRSTSISLLIHSLTDDDLDHELGRLRDVNRLKWHIFGAFARNDDVRNSTLGYTLSITDNPAKDRDLVVGQTKGEWSTTGKPSQSGTNCLAECQSRMDSSTP